MNSTTALLLILLLPFLSSFLIVVSAVPIQLKTPVGRPFTFRTAEGHAVDSEMLPRWCRFNASARLIYGIPQLDDFGLHLISIHDAHIEVEVLEEEEDWCGPDSSTIWLDIMDARMLAQLSIEEQFQTIQMLLATLKGEGKNSENVDLKLADVRLFPRAYLHRYRLLTETIHELDDDEDGGDDDVEMEGEMDGRIAFVMNISCGELTEQATEIISAVADNGMNFRVVEGELRKNRQPLTTTSTTTTTTTTTTMRTTTEQPINHRTTRRVHNNNRPIVLNPLKTFSCVRGQLCRLPVDENTFMDPEDGQTSRLTLSVHAIGNHTNFLVAVPGANMLEGVPMEEEGTYSFRLEARDKQNAASSAPFQVAVKPLPEGKPTHRYSMILDTPLERFHSKPELLRDFVFRLSATLHRLPSERPSQEWADAAVQIQIEQLLDNGAGQTQLSWWNASLSKKECDEQRINGTRDRMLHFGTERLRHDFVKAMGAHFHVRKVTMEFVGKCLSRHILDGVRIRVTTTTQRNRLATEREESYGPFGMWANQLLVPLILLATILLLITVLALLCCAQHKRGKKGKRTEFTTKGRPVVFPDEVPHRDESNSTDGSLATVTTPMLVEREQPPLDPTKMTMHENPLYRPPPQVQAQFVSKSPPQASIGNGIGGHQQQQRQHELSPLSAGSVTTSPRQQFYQQQQQSPPLLVSTFSPPSGLKPIDASPTPLRSTLKNPFLREHPYQQSVRVQHTTPVGQRAPPPYFAH